MLHHVTIKNILTRAIMRIISRGLYFVTSYNRMTAPGDACVRIVGGWHEGLIKLNYLRDVLPGFQPPRPFVPSSQNPTTPDPLRKRPPFFLTRLPPA